MENIQNEFKVENENQNLITRSYGVINKHLRNRR